MFKQVGSDIFVEPPPAESSRLTQGAVIRDFAALAGGKFAIVWRVAQTIFPERPEDPIEQNSALFIQRFGANGPDGPRVTLFSEDLSFIYQNAAIASASKNSISLFTARTTELAVWEYSGKNKLTLLPGSPVPGNAVEPFFGDALGLADERSVFLYRAEIGNGATQIFARLFDDASRPEGKAFRVSPTANADQWGPNVAQLKNGNLVVVFSQEGTSDPGDIRASIVSSADGSVVKAKINVNRLTEGEQYNGKVAALTSGGFAVVWVDRFGHDGSGAGVFCRVFDDKGRPLGREFNVDTGVAEHQFNAEIVALDGGRFCVVWETTAGRGGILGKVYDRIGNAITDETFLARSSPPSFWDQEPKVTLLDNGQLAMAFVRDIDEEGVLVRKFALPQAGTKGNDVLKGKDLGRVLEGLGGNDRITGTQFADTIDGGAGKDTMTGLGGPDTFVFRKLGESGPKAAQRDVITDFKRGTDVIDLSEIDAIAGTPRNDAFAFIGQAEFTALGQVRVWQNGKHAIVEVNAKGSLAPDMSIQLSNVKASQIGDGDFIL